jgi:hypothetical protein
MLSFLATLKDQAPSCIGDVPRYRGNNAGPAPFEAFAERLEARALARL